MFLLLLLLLSSSFLFILCVSTPCLNYDQMAAVFRKKQLGGSHCRKKGEEEEEEAEDRARLKSVHLAERLFAGPR